MSVPAKVGEAVPLVLILEDGNETQYPQAEIYAPGGTSPVATIDVDHKARGRYEGSWIPSSVGPFSAQFFVYSDLAHTVENIVYTRTVEQIFVSQSDVDDLAVAIVRLLGLSHENAFIDNTVFDTFGRLVSSRVRIYDSKANAEAAVDGGSSTTGLIASYVMTADYEGADRLKSYRYVLEP